MSPPKKDRIYADKLVEVHGFEFNEEVADVFPDMIRRSVPGYEVLGTLLLIIARRFVSEGTHVYDLGCSLGTASLRIAEALYPERVKIFAVDNSPVMIQRLAGKLESLNRDFRINPVCCDVSEISIENASLVILNYTLQFIEPVKRDALLMKIYSGMTQGSAMLLSEKIMHEQVDEESFMQDLHDRYKLAQGYSDLEISQKREALENVMVRDTDTHHLERLRRAGFSRIYVLMKHLNFISYIAIK